MKIFISHSSKDKDYGDALVELLTGLGIHPDDIIFTSNDDYGIPVGENIFDWLKTQLVEKPYIFYLLSSNYYGSVACQHEIGAAWILENKQALIFTPEFNLKDEKFLSGALDHNKIGVFLDEESKMNKLIDSLKEDFRITSKTNLRNRKVRDFLAEIAKIKKVRLDNPKDRKEKQLSKQITSDTPKKEDLDEEKEVIEGILLYVEQEKEYLESPSDFTNHINDRFFKIPNIDREVNMFKHLWKLVLNDDDGYLEAEKSMRYRLLLFLFNKNKEECTALIVEDPEYFNNVSKSESCISKLIDFLAHNADLYSNFESNAGIYIRNRVKNNTAERIKAWFLSESFLEHLDDNFGQETQDYLCTQGIGNFIPLLNIGISLGYRKKIADLLISFFEIHFAEGEFIFIFNRFQSQFLDTLDEAQFDNLCYKLNYCQGPRFDDQNTIDLNDSKKQISLKFPNFEFSKYPNLFPEDNLLF